MKALKSLYNGIMNDYSIRHCSLGWQDIVLKLEKRYKKIEKTDEQFKNELLINALYFTNGSLRKDIKCFAKELSINTEALIEKQNRQLSHKQG